MLDNEAPERIFDASKVSKDCQKNNSSMDGIQKFLSDLIFTTFTPKTA